jgi:hypothetical protein
MAKLSDRESRLDRIEQLLERNVQLLAEYREWWQTSFQQSVAHYIAFDTATQLSVQNLAAAVERFIAASDERIRRVEAAADAIHKPNGKPS